MAWLLLFYLLFLLGYGAFAGFVIQTRILRLRYPGDATFKAVVLYLIGVLVVIVISFVFILTF